MMLGMEEEMERQNVPMRGWSIKYTFNVREKMQFVTKDKKEIEDQVRGEREKENDRERKDKQYH